MALKHYALIDLATNIVVNVSVGDDSTPTYWTPPENHISVQSDIAQIGWTYDPATGTFTDPNPQPAPEQ